IGLFNHIITRARHIPNCTVLTGYELELSGMLKKGSDIWLNNPRMFHEASGTSGMTAAMNGSINLSVPDGWMPEFATDKENCFIIPPAIHSLSAEETDDEEAGSLMDILEETILPMYYEAPDQWVSIMKKAAQDVDPNFESGRMVKEYYSKMYSGNRSSANA